MASSLSKAFEEALSQLREDLEPEHAFIEQHGFFRPDRPSILDMVQASTPPSDHKGNVPTKPQKSLESVNTTAARDRTDRQG